MNEMYWPEITKDTPLTEVKRIHQAIWDYTIRHGWMKPETPYPSSCVGCAYTNALGKDDCKYCPILWPSDNGCIDGGAGLYERYLNALILKHPILDRIRLRNIAKQIRDLPFKYELEEKKNV